MPFNNYKIMLDALTSPNTICTSVVSRSPLHETLLKQWSFKNLKKPESSKIVLKLGLQPQWNIKINDTTNLCEQDSTFARNKYGCQANRTSRPI